MVDDKIKKTVEEAAKEVPEVPEVPEVTSVTEEELTLVKIGRDRLSRAVLEAEKAVAIKQIADLELKNIILGIYNKYKLTAGVDSVLEDGTIVKPEVGE